MFFEVSLVIWVLFMFSSVLLLLDEMLVIGIFLGVRQCSISILFLFVGVGLSWVIVVGSVDGVDYVVLSVSFLFGVVFGVLKFWMEMLKLSGLLLFEDVFRCDIGLFWFFIMWVWLFMQFMCLVMWMLCLRKFSVKWVFFCMCEVFLDRCEVVCEVMKICIIFSISIRLIIRVIISFISDRLVMVVCWFRCMFKVLQLM